MKIFFAISLGIFTEIATYTKFSIKTAQAQTFAFLVIILTVCLSGNLQLASGREQKNPTILYNSRLRGAFVTWQEGGVVLARQITVATLPLCSPLCTSQQTCAIQDTCVPNTRGTP